MLLSWRSPPLALIGEIKGASIISVQPLKPAPALTFGGQEKIHGIVVPVSIGTPVF